MGRSLPVRPGWLVAAILVACAASLGAAGGPEAPANLRCEYRVDPIGIDVRAPRLSWWVRDARRGARQAAYQVLVATSPANLRRGRTAAWDSGRVASEKSVHVVYAGKPLRSGRRYWWKVRTWDRGGSPSPWSQPAFWEMGLLSPSDWQARWITIVHPESVEKELPLTGAKWIWHGSARRDHARIAAASSALAAGDIDEAARLRGEFEEGFAETTTECRLLDDALAAATEERAARLELERELELVEDAREALARVPEMPRATRHSDRLDVLNGARATLSEAEALRGGIQYPDAAELVARLLSEETRFSIGIDGTVLAAKSTGVSYTQAARQVVEWVLERELRSSGRSFPHSNEKSADEKAWARYLADAAHVAGESGVDFTALLEAVDEVVELRLPDPVAYFVH